MRNCAVSRPQSGQSGGRCQFVRANSHRRARCLECSQNPRMQLLEVNCFTRISIGRLTTDEPADCTATQIASDHPIGVDEEERGSFLVHVPASRLRARFVGHAKNTFGEYFLRYKQEFRRAKIIPTPKAQAHRTSNRITASLSGRQFVTFLTRSLNVPVNRDRNGSSACS